MMPNFSINFFKIFLILFPFGLITGPFLTDFLISIFGIYFLYFCFKNQIWYYFKDNFFKLSLIFYLIIILSGLFSSNPYESLIDYSGPIFYFRNFIFIASISFLFSKEKNIKTLLYSFLLIIFFVMFDALVQFIFGSNLFGMKTFDYNRLTGIFGKEQILGHYLSYTFPICCTLYFMIFSNHNNFHKSFLVLFSLLILIIAFISGDRTGFLKLIIFIIFAGFIVKEYRKLFSIILVILFSLSILLINFNEKSNIRFNDTIRDISNNKTFLPISSGHEDLFLSGFNLFLDYPILGAGPQMYRVLCKTSPKYSINDVCTTHVHNYYFQTIGELGLIGLLFLLLLYFYLIKSFFKSYFSDRKNYPFLLINLHLLISLLPFISHFNFYNNWVNPTLALSFGIFIFLKNHYQKYEK